MPDFVAALIFDSSINLAGLERDTNAAATKLRGLSAEANNAFQKDIARGLGKAVRPENFASDLARSKALLGEMPKDVAKIFERELGRNLARKSLQPFVDEAKTLTGQLRAGLSDTFSIRNIAAGFLSANAIAGALRGLFDIGKATVSIARDAEETRNRFNETFKSLSAEVRAFANSYAQEVGRSRIETESFLATISGIFTTVGFAGNEAAEFSKTITKLTFDLASFFNVADSEALTALRSGLIGESEPLRRFNVFLSEARVAQEALAQGINKTSKELTEQDKIFLRYKIILKDTITAQGDAVRTSDSLANQQKRLSANFQNLGDTLGKIFVPALADATKNLNTFLENLTKTFTGKNADLISSFFGTVREEAKRMQDELDSLVKKSTNTTEFVFPGTGSKFSSNEAAAIKAFFDAESIARAAEAQKKIETSVQATSDDAQTLSSSAKNTADEFERAAEVLERMGDIGKQFQGFQRGAEKARKGFESEQDEFEKFQKEIAQSKKDQQDVKKEREEFLQEGKKDLEDFLREEAERLRQRQELIKQSAINLADLVDQRLGDITASFIEFFDAIKNPNASVFSNLVGGFGVFDTVVKSLFGKGFFESILSGIFGSSKDAAQKQRDELARVEQEEQYAKERARVQTERFTGALKELEDALIGADATAGDVSGKVSELFDTLKLFAGLNESQARTLAEALRESQKTFGVPTSFEALIAQLRVLALARPDLTPLIDQLEKLDPIAREILLSLLPQLGLALDALDKFGNKVGKIFDSFIGDLNLRFDLLNIDDPLKKLDLLSKGIREKFKAIIPTTDAGIRDLIAQGLAALEAGGQTLVDFLKSLDLEELTADQFRDLLQLLNSLANEAKNKVAGIDDSTTRVSLIRSITFEQGNRLLDENTTMRILQTNMVDIQMQMLNIMKDSLRGGISSASLSRGGAPNIFIMRDGNVRRASTSELTELERLQADRFLAEAKGMGLA